MKTVMILLGAALAQLLPAPTVAQPSEPTVQHARSAYKDYLRAKQNRAFATAKDGAWAWCAEQPDEKAASDCALEQCGVASNAADSCKLAHVNSRNVSDNLGRDLSEFSHIKNHYDTYLAQSSPKAFALSNANRFGYCFAQGDLGAARRCALQHCKKGIVAGADCRVVSENGVSTIGDELSRLIASQQERLVEIEVSDGVSGQKKTVDGVLRYNRHQLSAELLTNNGARLCRLTFTDFDAERPRFDATCFGGKQFSGVGQKVGNFSRGELRNLPKFVFKVSRGQSYLQVTSREE